MEHAISARFLLDDSHLKPCICPDTCKCGCFAYLLSVEMSESVLKGEVLSNWNTGVC